jgi:hypothetical protein
LIISLLVVVGVVHFMAVVVVQADIAQELVYLLRQEIHTLSPLELVVTLAQQELHM